MNMYTQEIADLLKVNIEVAMKIQYELECSDFDFSKSSSAKLKRSAKAIFKEL